MTTFSRTDMSLLGRWWRTIDRWTISAVAALMLIGVILILAASPSVAERYEIDMFHFVNRQFLFLPLALVCMLAISMLSSTSVCRLSIMILLSAILLMVLTLIGGTEIKGATRWVRLGGLSLQPSEFVKPSLAVVTAWMFATWRINQGFPGHLVSLGVYITVIILLLAQPDIGMAILISFVWGIQLFLAGLPMVLVMGIGVFFIIGGFASYFQFQHVRERIDRFVDPQNSEAYQVRRSLEAFNNGGIFGRGPGEGQVKELIPDVHSDFIFAVAGEEFGMIAGLIIIVLFSFILLRGFIRAFKETDMFIQLSVAGLLSQFGLQTIINLASTVNLMPTKGMTLPFISYGGSSLFAVSVGMGMILALTRERPGSSQASTIHLESRSK